MQHDHKGCGDGCIMLPCFSQATQVLKADDEREFIVVRDEYKGGDIRLSLRKFEVFTVFLQTTQNDAFPDMLY